MFLILQILFNISFTTQILADDIFIKQQQRDNNLFKQFTYKPVPQSFVQLQEWPWVAKEKPMEIIYGNDEIGFFSSKNFTFKDHKIQLQFIPPTFRKKLQFFVLNEYGSQVQVGDKKYENPFQQLSQMATAMESPSFPFVMLSGTTRLIPMVINRLGEVVWLFNNYEPLPNPETSAIDILENGEFMFMTTRVSTRLTWMDSFGKIKQDVSFRKEKIPYPNSHTIQYLPDSKEVLFLSYDCRELSRWDEFIPFFSGWRGLVRLLRLPRRTYMGSKLLKFSLETHEVKEIWSTFNNYSPDKNPSLAEGYLLNEDRFLDVKNEDQYIAFLKPRDFLSWWNWPDQHCNVDWTHENSAQYVKGKGYLISVRNLNELIFLNEQGQKVWTMGEGPGHTYNLPVDDRSFSMQHSATYLESNKVLIYDNHSSYRGFSDHRMFNRIAIVPIEKKGDVAPVWITRPPSAHSHVRGSTAMLPNGNIFVYTAGDPGVPTQIFEIDYQTKRPVGSLFYPHYQGAKGFEAKPFWSFGGDRYLGGAKAVSHFNPLLQAPATDDVLKFSY